MIKLKSFVSGLVVVLSFFSQSVIAADAAFTVKIVDSNSALNSLSQATSVLQGTGVTQQYQTINLHDGTGGVGHFANSDSFPYDDTFALQATRTITVLSEGNYTFGFNSDDGARLSLNGGVLINDDTLHAPRDFFKTIYLTPGDHEIELIYFENGGGATVELFYVEGDVSVFNSDFSLLEGSIGSAPANVFTAEFVQSPDPILSLAMTESLLNNPAGNPRTVWQLPEVNLFDNNAISANFASDTALPYQDQVAARFRRTINVMDAGQYTLGFNSDDGARLSFGGNVLINDDSLHGSTNFFKTVVLAEGEYDLEMLYFENGGGATVELFYAPGVHTSVDNSFSLLNGTMQGGLPEITYNPANDGQWGDVIEWPHIAVSMANLPDGRVLSFSGSEREIWPRTEQTQSASWNPENNEFFEVFQGTHNMFCGHMAMMEDGQVFVNGGRNGVNTPWTTVFDYRDNQWIQRENMASAGRWYPTTLQLPDGDMFTGMGTATVSRYPERWDSQTGWQILNGIDFNDIALTDYASSGTHGESRWWPLFHVAPNGKIFHSGPTPDMHWIDPANQGSYEKVGGQVDQWYHKHGTTVMYDEGKSLTAGGWRSGNDITSTNRALTIDINNSIPDVQNTESMQHSRKFHNGVMLPTGDVMVVGGNSSGKKFSDEGATNIPEFWDPETGRWTAGAPMSVARGYHSTALLLVDGRVLSTGGGYCSNNAFCSGSSHRDGQVYSPAYLFNDDGSLATRPSINNVPGIVRSGDQFIVSTDQAINRFTMIKMSATTHGMNTDLRFLNVDFNDQGNNQYLLDANANVLTLGYWMLFALDSQGTPSVASVVRIERAPDEGASGNAPTITAEPNIDVQQSNTDVNYTVTASGDSQLRYQWNFGDNSVSAWSINPAATHRYQEPGFYVVSVTVIDARGNKTVRSFTQLIHAPLTANKPLQSGAIIEHNDIVWNVNPDNDSVTLIDANEFQRINELAVGNTPKALAVDASNNKVWVTNKASASISIIDINSQAITRTYNFDRGTQPHGIIINNGIAYVALEATGEVVKIDANNYTEIQRATIGDWARHVSLNAARDHLYVTRFITPPLPGEATANVVVNDGNNLYGGIVVDVNPATLAIRQNIVLAHSDVSVSENTGPGVPNYLGSAAISPDGLSLRVPSKQDNILSGSLRGNAGMTFDQTVRAVTSKVHLLSNLEHFVNRVDHDNSSMATHAVFGPRGAYVFSALEGNREIAISNSYESSEVLRFDADRAPQGLVLSDNGERLFVHNFMSRSVTIHDISEVINNNDLVVEKLATVSTVATDDLSNQVLKGKQLFYDSKDTRLATQAYMSCASCHHDGQQDGRVWDFTHLGEGLRNTITLEGNGKD